MEHFIGFGSSESPELCAVSVWERHFSESAKLEYFRSALGDAICLSTFVSN